MPQRECGALERAQAAERFLHAPLNLRALREPLRARRPGSRHLHRRVEAVAARLIVARLFHSHHVHRTVRDDAIEPGAEIGARLEASELLVGAKETLLHHVFGILLVSVIRNASRKTLRLCRSTSARNASLSPWRARARTAA